MIYEINHIGTAEIRWRWRNDRRSERNLCNCVKKPEKIQDFNGVWTRDLAIPVRCSTNWAMKPLTLRERHLHFISVVPIWFTSYIINTQFFHGNIWTHNWPAPNVSGFITQLVEHRTGNREVTGSNPVEVLNFFFSGFFTQLHKLRSLRRSFLHLQLKYSSKINHSFTKLYKSYRSKNNESIQLLI